jgi:hypothetical protein
MASDQAGWRLRPGNRPGKGRNWGSGRAARSRSSAYYCWPRAAGQAEVVCSFAWQAEPSYADGAWGFCRRRWCPRRGGVLWRAREGEHGGGVQRAEMTTRDMDVIAELINRQYVDHRATFRCADPSRVDAGARSVIADSLEAAVVRYRGFYYRAQVRPPDDFLALVTLSGTGTLATAREQVHFTTGDALIDPIDAPTRRTCTTAPSRSSGSHGP